MMQYPTFSKGRLACSRPSGMTLIEIMIVVAIVAILAAIAYPSYRDHIRRSDRADAKAILLENAQLLERNFTMANRYDSTTPDGTGAEPAILAQSPKAGDARYEIEVEYLDADGIEGQLFTLTAVPVGVMVGDPCGELTLASTGVRGANGETEGDIIQQCWGR